MTAARATALSHEGEGVAEGERVRGCGGPRCAIFGAAAPHPAASQPPSPYGRRITPTVRRMVAAVSFQNVSRHFGAVRAVDDVSLEIARRRVLRHARAVGLGQDDLPAADRRLRPADRGHIEIFGETAEGVPPYRRNVNTVFQDYALFPHMSVLDNVAYGLMVKGVAEARARRAGARGAGAGQARRHGGAAAGAAFRRPAAARGARPRAGQPAEGAAPRRAARRARPEAARADAGGAEGAAAAARHHLRLRHPRPGRGAVDGRPRGDLQRGQARAGRHAARRLRAAADALRRRFRRLLQRARPGFLRAHWRHRAPGRASGRRSIKIGPRGIARRTAGGSTARPEGTVAAVQYQGADHARRASTSTARRIDVAVPAGASLPASRASG